MEATHTTFDLVAMGREARAAARHLARATTDQKNAALCAIADAIDAHAAEILAANAADMDDARAAGLSPAMLDRLNLAGRLAGIARAVRAVAVLPDPVGEHFDEATLPNGLRIAKRRTPLGVVGVIYEARPNVTVDVAALTLKTGNAAILRGGKETIRSNTALIAAIHEALRACGLPTESLAFIASPDREYVTQLLKLDKFVDVIIPRGGNSLHEFCRQNSTIPVITGGIGICHLYVDEQVDLDRAVEVIFNAKTQRPTVCNALDTVLVHEKIARALLPKLVTRLAPAGVTFRLDPGASGLLGTDNLTLFPAGPSDWDTEWLSLVLGVRVVAGLESALEHIHTHSTAHSDGILTEIPAHAERFLNEVDSAVVYVNASTRFTDGGEMGLGAEIAVSTQKLHARGPMGLRELTTYKYIVRGDYQVRG